MPLLGKRMDIRLMDAFCAASARVKAMSVLLASPRRLLEPRDVGNDGRTGRRTIASSLT